MYFSCVFNLFSALVTVHRDEKVATFSVRAVCSVDEVCTLQSNEQVGCGTNGIPQFGSEPDLPDDKMQRFNNLVQDFTDIFAHADEDLGRTPLTKHTIQLKGSITPIKQHYRRVPFFQRPVMQQLIRKMLADNIIEPSSGPWASPVVLVTKKDGSARFCVDFRKLNAVTQKDAHHFRGLMRPWNISLAHVVSLHWIWPVDTVRYLWMKQISQKRLSPHHLVWSISI